MFQAARAEDVVDLFLFIDLNISGNNENSTHTKSRKQPPDRSAPSAVPRLLPYIDIYIHVYMLQREEYVSTHTHAHIHACTYGYQQHTIQTLTYTRKYAHAVTSIPPHTHTCSSSTSQFLNKYNISSAIALPLSVRYFTPHLPSRPSYQYPRKHSSFTCFFFFEISTNQSLALPLPNRPGEGGRGVEAQEVRAAAACQEKSLRKVSYSGLPRPQTCPPRNQRGEEAVQPRPSGRLQAAVPRWMVVARQAHW